LGELYLPVLSHFQNENVWTASLGRMHFIVTPGGESLTAELWEGPWSYDLSTVEETCGFPMDEAGMEALRVWLIERAAQINLRPERTLDENLARRADREG
jgi:hypothetical protein